MQEQDPVLITKKVYDDIAKEYAETYYNWPDIESYTSIFFKYLRGNKILDVGCGSGRDAKYFVNKNYEYVGLDISEGMIKIAKEKNPNANFVLGDMRKLPFENNSFDGIWSMSSLLHIPKTEIVNVLKEFNRVLNKDGIFYCSLQKGTFEGFRENDSYDKQSRYFSYFLEDEIKDYLEKAGFQILELFNKELKSGKADKINTWINVFAIKK